MGGLRQHEGHVGTGVRLSAIAPAMNKRKK
jgi:hypothetical protein